MDIKEKIKNLSPEKINLLLAKSKKTELPSLEGSRTDRYFPLSFSQKRLWFQAELENNPAGYNNTVAFVVKVKRPLDLDRLKKTVNTTIQRHEILRTTFHFHEGQPVQLIKPALNINISYTDLRAFHSKSRMEKGIELATEDTQRPFDLAKGPLIRFSVFQLDDLEYILLTTSHHLISDGWSNNLFFMEMTKGLFLVQQEEGPVCQYLDFVFWEKKRFEKLYLDKLLVFWKNYLAGELPITKFPQEELDGRSKKNSCSQKSLIIDSQLSHQIREFSKTHRVTLFVSLLAIFKVLLSRYTQENDLLIGLPYANRLLPEFQKTLGLFINIIPFRTQVNREGSFLSYLKEVDLLTKKVFSHAEIPYNVLVEHIKPNRNLGTDPLFQILYVHQNFPHAYDVSEVKATPLPIDNGQAQYNFTFVIEEFQNEILLKIKYKESLYDSFFIEQIFAHYTNILKSIVADPEQIISTISYLSLEEQEWLLKHAHHKDYLDTSPSQRPLFCAAFESQARLTPHALALSYLEKSFTYEELNTKANQLAHYIKTHYQPNREDRVGIFLERSEHFLIALLAILKTGCAFVPLDTAIPKDRTDQLLQGVGVSLLLTTSELASKLIFNTTAIFIDKDKGKIEKEKTVNLDLEIGASDLAYIIFTSGSTGYPKGVAIEHGHLASYLESIAHEIDPFNLTNFAFTTTVAADMGYTNLFLPLTQGKSVVIIPKTITDDPDLLSSYLSDSPVDCLKFVPSQLAFLLKAKNPVSLLPQRLLILAGESTPYSIINEVKRLNPHCKIIISYGPTEITVGAMTNQSIEEKPWQNYPLLGHPNLNDSIYILDDKMELVPLGVAGEIYIGGPSVARGYFNQPQLTEQSFLPDRFSKKAGGKLYRTGDKARYLRSGEIEFLGRKDRQIKIRGYRVEPGEIEAAIRKIQGVNQTAVCVVDSLDLKRLVAFVVQDNQAELSEQEIKRQLHTLLPSYMIPSQFLFLNQLPLTPSGKIDFKMLTKHLTLSKEKAINKPRDTIEFILLKIWKEVLKIENIGIHESFFDLGGHSFLALELVIKIEEAFGIRMPLGALFETNTIELFADSIRKRSVTSQQKPLVTIRKGDNQSPFFFVHPAGGQVLCYYELTKHLKGNFSFYGLQTPFLEEQAQEEYNTIQKIAVKYLDSLQDNLVNAENLIFGGWSLGGLIAFEMAQEFFTKKKKYPLVIIIDQPVPSFLTFDSKAFDEYKYLGAFMQQVEGYNDIKFDINYEDLYKQSFKEQASIVYRSFITEKILPSNVNQADFLNFLHLQKTYSFASRSYIPNNYNGPVLLIRAQTSQWDEKVSESLGWGRVAPRLNIQWTPGTHFSIMKSPEIEQIAKIIETWLLAQCQL